MLALGCEDGSIQIISLMHDTLTHQRRLERVKCRLLSVAWGPPVLQHSSEEKDQDVMDEDEESSQETDYEDWSDQWLVAGCSDSSLRKWDVVAGRVLDRMTTDKVRGEQTLVWSVGVIGSVLSKFIVIFHVPKSLFPLEMER
jgi:U3 small nucleolar RNA-associated protein 4